MRLPFRASGDRIALFGATRDELGGSEFAAGSMGPKVRAACHFVDEKMAFLRDETRRHGDRVREIRP